MVQQLRAFAALVEDLASDPNTPMMAHNLLTTVQEIPHPFLISIGTKHAHGEHVDRQSIHTQKTDRQSDLTNQ